jgi:hypothetical protein
MYYNIRNNHFYSIPPYLAAQEALYKLKTNQSLKGCYPVKEFGSTMSVINLKTSSNIGTVMSILPNICGLSI